jgi:hypothetical protein
MDGPLERRNGKPFLFFLSLPGPGPYFERPKAALTPLAIYGQAAFD